MANFTVEPILAEELIRQRVSDLAADIQKDFPERVHVIVVLKGAFMFASDLVRRLSGEISLDFIALSSYGGGTTASGEVRLLKDLDVALEGRDVLIVEDIVDTGLSLAYLQQILRARGPSVLRTACLLDKPSRRRVEVRVDYVGFTVGDRFLVGYGLDYAERFRNLPYIGAIDV